jgi:hypothetical protein
MKKRSFSRSNEEWQGRNQFLRAFALASEAKVAELVAKHYWNKCMNAS